MIRRLILLILLLQLFTGCCDDYDKKISTDMWDLKRNKMVESQIKMRGIDDSSVLEAMRKVPRHEFVPKENRKYSYEDYPLPIGYNQTISQPSIVAAMTEALELTPEKKVLEIGTGSGYQAAVLAEIVHKVYSIEIVPELAKRAGEILKQLNYTNVNIRTGDGYIGWPEEAPFDTIIVTCAPDSIPEPLVEQLKEGGNIVIPVGGRFGQQLIKVTKKDGELISETLMGVRFVPMTGKAQ